MPASGSETATGDEDGSGPGELSPGPFASIQLHVRRGDAAPATGAYPFGFTVKFIVAVEPPPGVGLRTCTWYTPGVVTRGKNTTVVGVW